MRNGLLYIVVIALLNLGIFAISRFEPAYAAGINGCEAVGTVGNIIVAKCVHEESGDEVWANSAWLLVVVTIQEKLWQRFAKGR